jgi:hypothetical protein
LNAGFFHASPIWLGRVAFWTALSAPPYGEPFVTAPNGKIEHG